MENATLPGIQPAQKLVTKNQPVEHSPGPWEPRPSGGQNRDWSIFPQGARPSSGCICKLPNRDGSERTTWKNAALISAAPDLLAALRFLVAVADAEPFTFIGHLVEHGEVEIRAAIAKAEGRS